MVKGGAQIPQNTKDGRDTTNRVLSLPKQVAKMGLEKWNQQAQPAQVRKMMDGACTATTVEGALEEVRALIKLGHNFLAYVYLQALSARDKNLYYATLLGDPATLMPICYTPTVGEACQKFGLLPVQKRGCWVSLTDRGNVKAVLREYAEEMLPKRADGKYECQCIVFSDCGRILGLGDLAAWGMGIPIGKLDLYSVCGGFDPSLTMPVVLDSGCLDPDGNTDNLVIRDHEYYTGLKQNRVKHKSAAGTDVNTCHFGKDSFVGEFMTAAAELFGKECLLQFEDFNSNDAFPLLAETRNKYLTYNDDIQGTAGVTVAGILGGVKLNNPELTDLLAETRKMKFLFHGAGAANLGAASLLINEGGVPAENVVCTNSRGVIWRSADGKDGSYRNDEQKAAAQVGKPDYDATDLLKVIDHVKPDVLAGAVGKDPGCFTKAVVEAMLAVQAAKPGGGKRPVIFALSNPMTQAEISAKDCYAWSGGKAIFGSGTRFPEEVVNGQKRSPGMVNNYLIFPGLSFGAYHCQTSTVTDRMFLISAEAVANSLDANDLACDSVVPHPNRCREVGEAVALATVMEAQAQGLAQIPLGKTAAEVSKVLKERMWSPTARSKL